MLSIGKLAYLAQAQDANTSTDDSTLDGEYGNEISDLFQFLMDSE